MLQIVPGWIWSYFLHFFHWCENLLPGPYGLALFIILWSGANIAILLLALSYHEVAAGHERLGNKPHRLFHAMLHSSVSYVATFLGGFKTDLVPTIVGLIVVSSIGILISIPILIVNLFFTPRGLARYSPRKQPVRTEPPPLTQPQPD